MCENKKGWDEFFMHWCGWSTILPKICCFTQLKQRWSQQLKKLQGDKVKGIWQVLIQQEVTSVEQCGNTSVSEYTNKNPLRGNILATMNENPSNHASVFDMLVLCELQYHRITCRARLTGVLETSLSLKMSLSSAALLRLSVWSQRRTSPFSETSTFQPDFRAITAKHTHGGSGLHIDCNVCFNKKRQLRGTYMGFWLASWVLWGVQGLKKK